MTHPMTPIELIASAFSIIATGCVFWWGMRHLFDMAIALYERFQGREGE